MKKLTLISLFLITVVSGCAKDPGPRLREIERLSDMSDEEIDAAKESCYKISTTDYNCSSLIEPSVGMSTEEWQNLTEQTKLCRKNQALSFNACLRGKGVRYSEFY